MRNGLKVFTLVASTLGGAAMAEAQQTPIGGVVIDGRHVPGGVLNGRPVLPPDGPGGRLPPLDPVRLAILSEGGYRAAAIRHWENARNAGEPAEALLEALLALESFRKMRTPLAQEAEIFSGDRGFLATAASRFIRDEIENITADLVALDGWDEKEIRRKMANAIPNAVLAMEFGKGRSVEEAIEASSTPAAVRRGLKDAGATPDQIKRYEEAAAAVEAALSQPVGVTLIRTHDDLIPD